jgi:uncharacterized protein YndB with AHSA1/START domain
MALSTSTTHTVRADRARVWQAWTDPEEVCDWLELRAADIPRKVGDGLMWSFNRHGRLDLVFTARLTALIPAEFCAYDWDVPGNDQATKVTVEFTSPEPETTKIAIHHAGFSETLESRLEFDGYDHHWWHYLERLGAYLEKRPFQFHTTLTPPRTGIIPLGVTAETGMVVKDVVIDSACEAAGVQPGDAIRSIDGIRLNEMEDFHKWLDVAVAGQVARLELADRTVDITLRPHRG